MEKENFNYYLITDPKYYTNDIEKFKKKLTSVLKSKRVDMACFRDKSSSNYDQLATVFVDICKKFKIKRVLLNENISLAKKLNCAVHLTSGQFKQIKEAKKENIYTIISCHNENELKNAQDNYADAITYSPIFETPNKGKPKGIDDLKEVLSKYKVNIIALGGIINEKQINQIKDSNAYGFASIRYFV